MSGDLAAPISGPHREAYATFPSQALPNLSGPFKNIILQQTIRNAEEFTDLFKGLRLYAGRTK